MRRSSLGQLLVSTFALAACDLPNPFERDEQDAIEHSQPIAPPPEPHDAGLVSPEPSPPPAYDAGTCEFEGGRVPLGTFDAGPCKLCTCLPSFDTVRCIDLSCPVACDYKGRTYAEGDIFNDGCRTCTCQGAAGVSCDAQLCPSECVLGDRSFDAGTTLLCSDGCNQCTCREGAWQSTDVACQPLSALTVCAPETLQRERGVVTRYREGHALALAIERCPGDVFTLCTDAALTPSDLYPNAASARLWVGVPDDAPCDAPDMVEKVFDLSPLGAMLRGQLDVAEGPVTLVIESAGPVAYEEYYVARP